MDTYSKIKNSNTDNSSKQFVPSYMLSNEKYYNRHPNDIGKKDFNCLSIIYTSNLNSAYCYSTNNNNKIIIDTKTADIYLKAIKNEISSTKRRFISTQTNSNPKSYLCLELSEDIKSLSKIVICYFQSIPLHLPSLSPIFQINISLRQAHLSNEFPWGFSFTLFDNAFLVIGTLDLKLHESDEIINRNVYAYSGLLPGDIILSLNHRSIASYNGNLNDILQDMKNLEIHLQLIRCMNCIHIASYAFLRENTFSNSSLQNLISTTMKRIFFCELLNAFQIQQKVVLCSLENTLRASIMAAKEAFEFVRFGLHLWISHVPINTVPSSKHEHTQAQVPRKISKSPNKDNDKSLQSRNTIWFLDTRTLRNESLEGSPLYDDNDRDLYDIYEDGTRSSLFLDSLIEKDYSTWLDKRKQTWKKKRKFVISSEIQNKFWELNHHPSFQHWLIYSIAKWKRSYSWHQQKRRKLEEELEEVVHFPTYNKLHSKPCEYSINNDVLNQWQTWLRIRKNQWRVMWRKRQRKKLQKTRIPLKQSNKVNEKNTKTIRKQKSKSRYGKKNTIEDLQNQKDQFDSVAENDDKLTSILSSSHVYIDSHIEDEENLARKLDGRPPFDISFLFYSDLGAPDDVVAYILSFLPPSEHWRMLCINYVTSEAIKQRTDMWRNMCPNHWILPKRPRKPWHLFYITNLRKEEELKRKQSDDVMIKAARIIGQGDHLNKLQRLIQASEKKFRFHIDYVSDVVLERNSLLNLSVIRKRLRITKWLIEKKKADIETFDRGDFTPLLNAAYAGNRQIVRYLLGKKADRTKVGLAHYSKRLSHPDFKGLTAEGWARKKGFHDLANFIKLGLS